MSRCKNPGELGWGGVLVLLLGALNACRQPMGVDDLGIPAVQVISSVEVFDWPLDPVAVRGARAQGHVLTLQVQYRGDCQAHGFTLLVLSSRFNEQDFFDSVLSHDARRDSCETEIEDTLRFDLRPVRPMARAHFGPSIDGVALMIRGVQDPHHLSCFVSGILKEGCHRVFYRF